MSSWISTILPNDEYKQQRIVYFVAEAAVLVVIYLFAMTVATMFYSIETILVLMGGIALFLFYTLGRYVLSRIEYTEVFTQSEYTKELKKITWQTVSFTVLYFVIHSVITGFPTQLAEWIDIGGFLLTLIIIYFGIHYISLRRSYRKNQ